MGRVHGFTLLEVLVALLIVSLALSGLVAAGGQSVASSAHLRAKTIATLVASTASLRSSCCEVGWGRRKPLAKLRWRGKNGGGVRE